MSPRKVLGRGEPGSRRKQRNQYVNKYPYDLGLIVSWVNICVISLGADLVLSHLVIWDKEQIQELPSHSAYCFARNSYSTVFIPSFV